MIKNIKKTTVLILLSMFMVIIFFPISAYANESLNCKKWETTCRDAGKTKTLKVNGSKEGKCRLEVDDYIGSYVKWFTIEWSSDNKGVATVDKNGKVTIVAKKTGTANIQASVVIEARSRADRTYTYELATCKVIVRHEYQTIEREPTIWKAGGKIKQCKCGKEMFLKKQDFVYTEEFVKQRLEEIKESSPFNVSWFDWDGKLCHGRGYQTPEDYFEWLIKNKKYPKSILTKQTTATSSRGYKGETRQDSSEAGCHVVEVLLSGYQNYECISNGRQIGEDFDFDTDLKAGDIVVDGNNYYIFKEYQYDEEGEDRYVVFERFGFGMFFEDTCYYLNGDVYRLPNYKVSGAS